MGYKLQVVHHDVARDFYYQLYLPFSLCLLSLLFTLSSHYSLFSLLSLLFTLSSLYSLFSFSLCLTLSLSLSLSISLLFLLFSFSLSLSFSLSTICLFLPLCFYTSLKNPCSSKVCDKMIAAAAPNRRLHIYYIDFYDNLKLNDYRLEVTVGYAMKRRLIARQPMYSYFKIFELPT